MYSLYKKELLGSYCRHEVTNIWNPCFQTNSFLKYNFVCVKNIQKHQKLTNFYNTKFLCRQDKTERVRDTLVVAMLPMLAQGK
ncbi:unnamed protein product [Blepharisma stoltei]|uniref:Uncharacterized protein n=1 Tax=Blepharisma stoltei TaxID=1481888 RepID=A0AAU9IF89_9CILI|nr:unnamed protein product [Blepharisma stoltei]